MINPFIDKKQLSSFGIVQEYMYSMGSIAFHFIEIYGIVFIADAIDKEVF